MENINKDILLHQEEHLVTTPVRKTDILEMLANNKSVPVRLIKEQMEELYQARVESLRLAIDTAHKINHFEHQYKSFEDLLKDIDEVHRIADRNFKYLIGEHNDNRK